MDSLPLTSLSLVERQVSPELFSYISAGLMKVYGGVIRWAAGTGHGGQIVKHLVFPDALASQDVAQSVAEMAKASREGFNALRLGTQTIQSGVNHLQMLTQGVAAMSQATMVLSGLNLAVSAVGFAVVIHKLGKIEERLKEIGADVKAIRDLLQDEQHARLKNALQDLNTMSGEEMGENRDAILRSSRTTLGQLVVFYESRLKATWDLQEASALEELYVLCFLAHVRCSAELRMGKASHEDMKRYVETWHTQARRIVKDMCLHADAARFMSPVYHDVVSLESLAAWDDFAHGENMGMQRIERWRDAMSRDAYNLRKSAERDLGMKNDISNVVLDVFYPLTFIKRIKKYFNGNDEDHSKWALWFFDRREHDLSLVAPLIYRLMGRSDVLQGYEAQYASMLELKVTPSQFEARVREISQAYEGAPMLVVDPAAFSTN